MRSTCRTSSSKRGGRGRGKSPRSIFFVPVRVLSRVFRGEFLALLRQAQAAGQLGWHGELAALADPAAFAAWLHTQYQQAWVVDAKPPFGGPEQVLKYLARYTHRVALSNGRLVSLAGGEVVFTANDYAAAGRRRPVRLSAVEFLRRWLQHILPAGFVKIRNYGLLANWGRAERLAVCRALLALAAVARLVGVLTGAEAEAKSRSCAACGATAWELVAELPKPTAARGARPAALPDTS